MPLDRHKLHFGPYRTPRFKYGHKVECLARGEVTIVGLSDAPIAWPVGAVPGGKSPVLYKSLVRAVRREAACAVMHWWGITPWLVWRWRRKLGVPLRNEGDRRLMVAIGKSPVMRKALAAMWSKARDPVRRAKIAAAKRGKPRPPKVAAMLRTLQLGKHPSKTTRKKLSEVQRRRWAGSAPNGDPWKPWEDKLVRNLSPGKAAARTGRTMSAVLSRRRKLGVPDGRRRSERKRLGR